MKVQLKLTVSDTNRIGSLSQSESQVSQHYNGNDAYYVCCLTICPVLEHYECYCHKLPRCFSCIK